MTVTLEESELQIALFVAMLRHANCCSRGQRNSYGLANDSDGLQNDADGCLGEFAFAKAFNRFWNGKIGHVTNGDVGKVEVRSTRRPDGRLILHPEDLDDGRYVLARINRNRVDLRGWIYGKDGKQQQFWVTSVGRPAFFVPDEALTRFKQDREAA